MSTAGNRRGPTLAAAACVLLAAPLAAISQPGSVASWGSIPDPPPIGLFRSISAGGRMGVGIREDGTLAAWGGNLHGETNVPGGTFLAVDAAGDYDHGFCLAIRSDGTLTGWGYDFWHVIALAPSGTFSSLSASQVTFAAALRTDGTIAAWGLPELNTSGQLSPPAGVFASIAIGFSHGLALRADGTIAPWGDNTSGQTNIPPGTYTAIAAAQNYSLAIRSDGTIAAWGSITNNGIQNVPSGSFTAIAAGQNFAVGLRTDGTLAGWGTNTVGQAAPPAGTYTAISAGEVNGLAIRACYANCDGSGASPVLNVLDFGCFLNRFAAGDPWANCDGSTTPPVLNVLDFSCFLNRFAAGCP